MEQILETQTVALVRTLGGNVEFLEKHPVPTAGQNEVLAKVLYTGVCQSGMHFPHTSRNKKPSADKLPRPAYQKRHRCWLRRQPYHENQASPYRWARRCWTYRGSRPRLRTRLESGRTCRDPVLKSYLSTL